MPSRNTTEPAARATSATATEHAAPGAPAQTAPQTNGDSLRSKAGANTRPSTRAVAILTQAGVPFKVRAFKTDGSLPYGIGAAKALGVDPALVFKTLLAKVDGRIWCAIVPVEAQLDLKALAKAAGGKKAVMASAVEAQRATGYVVGGISPLGQRQEHPTLIDVAALDLDVMMVSAGARGMDVALAPTDLERLTGARYAPISRL
ncbi:MAG: Cys-tRNA(Pro) deacylase [Bifidobacteriaceae bacterium]|jgi:Cys-tRNA(Pro)/Cys-tRNA(Cys) deacylase|nr:Cys-tRNA(Pro) deacylase [Bifidobacteriaceae bacterium]